MIQLGTIKHSVTDERAWDVQMSTSASSFRCQSSARVRCRNQCQMPKPLPLSYAEASASVSCRSRCQMLKPLQHPSDVKASVRCRSQCQCQIPKPVPDAEASVRCWSQCQCYMNLLHLTHKHQLVIHYSGVVKWQLKEHYSMMATWSSTTFNIYRESWNWPVSIRQGPVSIRQGQKTIPYLLSVSMTTSLRRSVQLLIYNCTISTPK